MMRQAIRNIAPLYRAYGLSRRMVFPIRVLGARIKDRFAERNGVYLPPPPLRYRVSGSLNPKDFFKVGKAVAGDIRAIMEAEGKSLSDFGTVLDFGCGCARVLQFLSEQHSGCQFYGTDIDRELIEWCRQRPQLAKFNRNSVNPPISQYKDAKFDFIYSISVFTHLSEDLQFAWLKELRRITKPGGHLLLSVQNEASSMAQLTMIDRDELRRKGFLFRIGQTGFLKLDGLPDCYQTSLHTKEYIAREWSKFFTVIRHTELGINNHQDAVLLRNG